MAMGLIVGFGDASAYVAASSTRYAILANGSGYGTGFTSSTSSAHAWYDRAGTFSDLGHRVSTNGSSSGTCTFYIYIDGSAGNQSASVTVGTTGWYQDTSSTDTLTALSYVSSVTVNNFNATLYIDGLSVLYAVSGYSVNMPCGGFTVTTNDGYFSAGARHYSATESDMTLPVKDDITVEYLNVHVSANTSSNTVTFTVRKDSTDTALTCSIASSTTGTVYDSTHSVSFSRGDDYSIKVAIPGGGTVTGIGYTNFRTSQGFNLFAQTLETLADDFTEYTIIAGNHDDYGTTNSQAVPNNDFSTDGQYWKDLAVYVSQNSMTGSATASSRLTTTDGNQSVSITALTTGWYEEDDGIYDDIGTGDGLSIKTAAGYSSSYLVISKIVSAFGSVASTSSITKSLAYAVTSTPTKKTKTLVYTVETTPSGITKSLDYDITSTPTAKTKSLGYTVTSTPAAKTKSLGYTVDSTPTAETKSLAYSVEATPAAITKSLAYLVIATISPVTKGLVYAVTDKKYSRESVSTLPTTTNDLATLYDVDDVDDVATDDATRVAIVGSAYVMHLYKKHHTNNTDVIDISWNGQTDLAPSTATVYLQIWNNNTSSWDTLDSDSTSSVSTDFTMSGTKETTLSYYYTGDGNTVAVRVYQDGS